MSVAAEKEYRVKVPRWRKFSLMLVSTTLALLVALGFTVGGPAYLTYFDAGTAKPHYDKYPLHMALVLGCLWLLVLGVVVYRRRVDRLWERRASVRLTEKGFAFTDTHQRAWEVDWTQVEEVRAGARIGVKPGIVSLRGGGRVYRLHRWLENSTELAGEIIKRAGLVPTGTRWAGLVTVYRREA